MRTTAAAGNEGFPWLPVLLLLLAGPLVASSHPAQSTQSSGSPPLAAVHAELEGLEGEAFLGRLEAFLDSGHRTVALDALLLRAGRAAPPGLSGARADRREARRHEALAWMRDHAIWLARARDLVAAPDVDGDLRCAALRSLGEGERLRVAPDLVWALDGARFPAPVQECAREALFRLTGRRFRDAQHYAAAAAGWSARTREGIFADELLARVRENEELRIALLDAVPARVPDALGNGSPVIRAAAARSLARGVGRQGGSLAGALELLFARLEREPHPRALHAVLEALVGLVEGMEPDAAPVVRLRAALSAPGFADRLELAPTRAGVLARLPWPADGGHADAAGRIAALVGELADGWRPVDYEAVSLALGALEQHLARVPDPEAARERIASAQRVLLDLLGSSVPASVRSEAARAAGTVLSEEHSSDLLDGLKDAPFERMEVELLGSLTRLASGLEPEQEEARRLLETLRDLAADERADLRRRAIELLGHAAIDPLRSLGREVGVVDVLVERLAVEPVAGLRDALLETLGFWGPRPERALELLRLEGFDALLDGNHRRPHRLARCLSLLAGGDPDVVLAVVERLARDARADPPPSAPTRGARLRAALSVAVSPDESAVEAWPQEVHARLVGWCLERIAAGGSLEPAVLDRATGVHLAHAGEVAPLDVARLLAARNLARTADGLEPDGLELDRERVEALFAEALTRTGEDEEARRRVLLERARWRSDSGALARAARDWDALLFPEGSAEPAPGLDSRDLRRARTSYSESDPLRAARVALHLVTEPSWREGEAVTRLADVLALADLAVRAEEVELLEVVARHLDGVPPPTGTDGIPALPEDTLWSELLRDRNDHASLWRRFQDVREALREGTGGTQEGGEEDSRPREPGEDEPEGLDPRPEGARILASKATRGGAVW